MFFFVQLFRYSIGESDTFIPTSSICVNSYKINFRYTQRPSCELILIVRKCMSYIVLEMLFFIQEIWYTHMLMTWKFCFVFISLISLLRLIFLCQPILNPIFSLIYTWLSPQSVLTSAVTICPLAQATLAPCLQFITGFSSHPHKEHIVHH